MNDGPHRVFLVGDPKQAIYGFRNADVGVYLKAAQELAAQGAVRYSLDVNWRSVAELRNACNRLFTTGWFPPELGILCAEVAGPAENEAQARLIADTSNCPAMSLVDFGATRTSVGAREEMARFTARQIASLLRGPQIHFQDRAGETHALNPSHICILVAKRAEAEPIEAALDSADPPIPHTFYKKSGLFQSKEAAHLSCLLHAIAAPGNSASLRKALLTHFFHIPASRLADYADLAPEHPIRRLFARWRRYADKRVWARLFQSIIEDTGVFWPDSRTAVVPPVPAQTGWTPAVRTPSAVNSSPDMERRAANYLQVLELLETQARREHLDFIDVLTALDRYRRRSVELADDRDLHRLESEKDKVRLMTIHASKGMEFPIVFLAGGFTTGYKARYYKYHASATDRGVVYDLRMSAAAKECHEREENDEKRRLYYVALTRAQFKVFVPFVPLETGASTKKGKAKTRPKAGPLTTIVHPAVMKAFPDIKTRTGGEARLISPRDFSVGPAGRDAGPTAGTEARPTEFILAEGLLDDPAAHRACTSATDSQQSFSGLSRFRRRRIEASFGEEPLRDTDEETDAPQSTQSTQRTAISDGDEPNPSSASAPSVVNRVDRPLPAGKTTGWVLHSILETADYAAVGRASAWEELLDDTEFLETASAAMARFGLKEPYGTISPQSAQRTAVGPACAGRIHELNFHYALPRWSDLAPSWSAWTKKRKELETRHREKLKDEPLHKSGYMNGVIDLVFRVPMADAGRTIIPACRYFLLDWKSNALGDGNYGPEGIQACMFDHKYDLQYRLYALALRRWLAQCGLDPHTHFGGVFYLFLRGVNPGSPGSGIFHSAAAYEDGQLEEELFVLLNRISETAGGDAHPTTAGVPALQAEAEDAP